MKIEISNDKSSATIDGIEYELKQVTNPFIQCVICGKNQYSCDHETKPKFEVWKPKVGEVVWFNNINGEAIECRYSKENVLYRFFQTKEQAIEAHEKAMFNYEVEMFIKEKNEGWIPDWTDFMQIKCLITFNDGFLDCDFCRTYKATSDCKYFKSPEIGKEIIAKFDNEKLVKWWI